MRRITSPILFLLFCIHTNAQQAFNNSGNLQIHPGTSVSGFGNFSNTSSGVLVNNGNLYIKGTIANGQSSMTIGTGTLYLNGFLAQSISGAQPFKTYHLNTNNSFGITLNNNLSVSGTHTFASGIITTSATPNYLIYEAGSSYTGDADSRHVNGWVKKFGATNFIFPVGNGTVERTIELNNLSVSSQFDAKYFANTPFTDVFAGQLQIPVWDVNESEYWTINKVTGGSARLTMNWDYNKVYFPNWIVSDILVAGYNGSVWTDNGGAGTASGTTTTTGTITSNSISAFNLFALGSRSFILPLTLVSFTAYRQDNYTQIDWKTEQEYNMKHFVVERSDDGRSFYAINQLTARNSGNTEQYYTRDHAPVQHTAYYRLKSVDGNGRENLSRTVAVRVIVNTGLTLMANPVIDKVVLKAAPALNGMFNYTIIAMNGQLIQQGKLLIQNGGSYQIPFNKNITTGTYALEVSNGFEKFNYKLVVQ
jgi:hypothetical protein